MFSTCKYCDKASYWFIKEEYLCTKHAESKYPSEVNKTLKKMFNNTKKLKKLKIIK